MSKLTYLGTFAVPLENISWSEFSANEMTADQSDRLHHELEQFGVVVNLPSLLKIGPESYEVLGGRHRITEWQKISHEPITCNIFEGELTNEEKFNLVNNLNTVHGQTSKSRLKAIIETQKLDLNQLDVFRHPTPEIVQILQEKPVSRDLASIQKKNDITKIAQKLSVKAARLLQDAKDAVLVCMVVDGIPMGVVNIDADPKLVKANLKNMRNAIEESLSDWIANGESVVLDDTE